MPTMQDVQDVANRWELTKERAEQHDFPIILFWDMKFTPLYNDLKKNWNEKHAKIFIDGMNKIIEKLGYV